MIKKIIFWGLFFLFAKINAGTVPCFENSCENENAILISEWDNFASVVDQNKPNRILHQLKIRLGNPKKIVAAIMAFPLPFGIVGMHRIYLGTEPYVPLVYIATVGGCFGILPMIDFFVIVFDKNPDRFMNNPRIFMWAK
ncbi:MAG: hypothetical protein IT235_02160 [Bacteroidia bacterium]|nr:hypothetical protein [Bacteroidia bacterium]